MGGWILPKIGPENDSRELLTQVLMTASGGRTGHNHRRDLGLRRLAHIGKDAMGHDVPLAVTVDKE